MNALRILLEVAKRRGIDHVLLPVGAATGVLETHERQKTLLQKCLMHVDRSAPLFDDILTAVKENVP